MPDLIREKAAILAMMLYSWFFENYSGYSFIINQNSPEPHRLAGEFSSPPLGGGLKKKQFYH
jgi:hypothetical protein